MAVIGYCFTKKMWQVLSGMNISSVSLANLRCQHFNCGSQAYLINFLSELYMLCFNHIFFSCWASNPLGQKKFVFLAPQIGQEQKMSSAILLSGRDRRDTDLPEALSNEKLSFHHLEKMKIIKDSNQVGRWLHITLPITKSENHQAARLNQ
ncbi:hypothetical protein SADUNF_Sadunf17G0084600 [Salix dunnii]|uniref:Uncharacterized protein n=1 Tax=Salix dunnii TaxID=1413687 RepID=A0A835J647_9ROSI|nr:hypothetical protein SADUNF_Sadunf17G0084600 [Salix dunnii]